MTLQTLACTELRPARAFSRTICPECGQMPLAPEASEFFDDGRIRHSWACDTCGNEFRTAVKLCSR